MIELIPDQPRGLIEFRARGKVTAQDYERVLVPAVEEALARVDGVRVLAHFGPDFEGYDLGALVDDAKLGLKHHSGFERCALVTDTRWLRHVATAIGFALPCPVKAFPNDQLDEARRWLRESLGSVHLRFDDEHDTVTVQLLGKLEPSAYAGMHERMDAWLSKRDHMRLLLDLREFDGWQGLGALHEHLEVVRDYRRRPERVAVVGEAAWQKLAARIMSQFVEATVRYFPSPEFDQASGWVRA